MNHTHLVEGETKDEIFVISRNILVKCLVLDPSTITFKVRKMYVFIKSLTLKDQLMYFLGKARQQTDSRLLSHSDLVPKSAECNWLGDQAT